MKQAPAKYTTDEIIRELQRIFRAFPRSFRKRLDAARDDTQVWDALGADLQRAGNVPFDYYKQFNSEEQLPPDDDGRSTYLEDGSCVGRFVLNKGCTSGRDWDKKLALACGGSVRILQVMASVLMPLYTEDCYYLRYDRKTHRYSTGPYRPEGRWEIGVLSRVRSCLKANGLKPISKRRCLRIVPGIRTECLERGKATVFDCLFSDAMVYTNRHFSYCEPPYSPDPLILSNSVSRIDEHDASGKLKQFWITLRYGEGESIGARISKGGRILDVSVRFGPHDGKALSRRNSPRLTDIWPALHEYSR